MKINAKDVVKTGTAVDETWDVVDQMRSILGDSEFLDNFIMSLPDDVVRDSVGYIARNYNVKDKLSVDISGWEKEELA